MQDLVLRSGDLPLAYIAGNANVQREVVHRALRGPKLPSKAVFAIIDVLTPELAEPGVRAATRTRLDSAVSTDPHSSICTAVPISPSS